jgi:type IV pilus assembly protein PilE
MKQHHTGFSLVELMIVLAIIAIVAGIAYPSYNNSVLKGRRAEAQVALLDLLQQQERYMTQRNHYLCFPNQCESYPVPNPLPFKHFVGDSVEKTHYTLTAQACQDAGGGTVSVRECIALSATPKFDDPDVGTLTITSTGTKSCTGSKPQLCWK